MAYHEAGHVIAGWFFEHAEPTLKVRIKIIFYLLKISEILKAGIELTAVGFGITAFRL